MKLTKYKILQGDTLDSIAKNYGIEVKELLDFHNSNSDLTQQIYGDLVPFHIIEIVLDSRLRNSQEIINDELLENTPRRIDYHFPPDSSYKIEISTSLYYLGKPVTENKIDTTWSINYNKEQYTVLLEVTDKNRIKIDSQVIPLLDIIDKINKATDSLHLQLNEDQSIKTVLNTEEILNRWEKIKYDDLRIYELEDSYFKLIIAAYDEEFSTLSKSIQSNILYQIFFYPRGNIMVPKNELTLIKKDQTVISQLFPQQFINYDLYFKGQKNKGNAEVFCEAKLSNGWSSENLNKQFQKNYATLIEDPFDFSFTLETKYHYDHQGVLKSSKTYVKEQANEKLFYISEYKITHLENENPETVN